MARYDTHTMYALLLMSMAAQPSADAPPAKPDRQAFAMVRIVKAERISFDRMSEDTPEGSIRREAQANDGTGRSADKLIEFY